MYKQLVLECWESQLPDPTYHIQYNLQFRAYLVPKKNWHETVKREVGVIDLHIKWVNWHWLGHTSPNYL